MLDTMNPEHELAVRLSVMEEFSQVSLPDIVHALEVLSKDFKISRRHRQKWFD